MKICLTHGKKPGKFCGECGQKLIFPPDVDTKAPYEVRGDKCPECDYDLNHGHQHFCPGCGHQLKWNCR